MHAASGYFPGAWSSWHLQVAWLHLRCWTIYSVHLAVIPIHYFLRASVAGGIAYYAKRPRYIHIFSFHFQLLPGTSFCFFFFEISFIRAIVTLLHTLLYSYATTCVTMQARAMADKEICVCGYYLSLRPLLLTRYLSHYDITSCSPSQVNSITHSLHKTRATSDS